MTEMPTFRLFYARRDGDVMLVLNWDMLVPRELDELALASLSRFIRAKADPKTLLEAEAGIDDVIAEHFSRGDLAFVFGRWEWIQERARFASLMH